MKVLDAALEIAPSFHAIYHRRDMAATSSEKEDGIHHGAPNFQSLTSDLMMTELTDEMGLVIEIITALRNIRGEMNVPPGEQIDVILRTRREGSQRETSEESILHSKFGKGKESEGLRKRSKSRRTVLSLLFEM